MKMIEVINNSILDVISLSSAGNIHDIMNDLIHYDDDQGIMIEFHVHGSTSIGIGEKTYYMNFIRYDTSDDGKCINNEHDLNLLKTFIDNYNLSCSSTMFVMDKRLTSILNDTDVIDHFKEPVIALYPNTADMIDRWRKIFKANETANYVHDDLEYNILVLELSNMKRFNLMTALCDSKAIFPGNMDVYSTMLLDIV